MELFDQVEAFHLLSPGRRGKDARGARLKNRNY